MNKVSIFTHVFDDSYVGASSDELEKNLDDLNKAILNRKKTKISYFSFDNDLFQVNVAGNRLLCDVIYSPSFNRQVSNTLSKTLLLGHQCAVKINDIAMLQNDIAKNFQFDASDINFYALWGLRFANPNSDFITNQNEENSFFENSTRSCLDNKTFWELKNVLFPKLEFLDNVKEGISIITGTEFNVIIKDLFLLNNYISEHSVKGFSYKFFKQATRVEISPETDQTLKNYGNYRTFNIPGKGTKVCDLHMKTPNYRTNIYPDEENEKMWITYIGTHMPTMEHPT